MCFSLKLIWKMSKSYILWYFKSFCLVFDSMNLDNQSNTCMHTTPGVNITTGSLRMRYMYMYTVDISHIHMYYHTYTCMLQLSHIHMYAADISAISRTFPPGEQRRWHTWTWGRPSSAAWPSRPQRTPASPTHYGGSLQQWVHTDGH